MKRRSVWTVESLSIKMNYSPSASMTGDVAKLVMRAASNAGAEWDLMLVTDAHHATRQEVFSAPS
ncbi:MAG: hypothetical protein ACREQ7_22600 [Candidatus Binatia bacterium]